MLTQRHVGQHFAAQVDVASLARRLALGLGELDAFLHHIERHHVA